VSDAVESGFETFRL